MHGDEVPVDPATQFLTDQLIALWAEISQVVQVIDFANNAFVH